MTPVTATSPARTGSPGRQDKPTTATSDLQRPTSLIVGFLAPAVLLYGVFFIYPMISSVYLSLFQGSAEAGDYKFVGLANFKKLLFDDPMFWTCVRHNIQFILYGGTGTLVLAMALAVGLTRCGRGRDFFRVVFLFPNVMAVVAVAILWSFVYNPSFGVLNALLRGIGLGNYAHAWLNEPRTALPALIFVQIWISAGFYMVLFYAGLLRIPADYLEAARIDGANFLQEFWHITLPMLGEILRIAVIYVVIGSLNIFALVFLVNEGRSNQYNNVLLTYLYEQGFDNGNYGYACAIAVMMVVLVLGSTMAISRILKPKVTEL